MPPIPPSSLQSYPVISEGSEACEGITSAVNYQRLYQILGHLF